MERLVSSLTDSWPILAAAFQESTTEATGNAERAAYVIDRVQREMGVSLPENITDSILAVFHDNVSNFNEFAHLLIKSVTGDSQSDISHLVWSYVRKLIEYTCGSIEDENGDVLTTKLSERFSEIRFMFQEFEFEEFMTKMICFLSEKRENVIFELLFEAVANESSAAAKYSLFCDFGMKFYEGVSNSRFHELVLKTEELRTLKGLNEVTFEDHLESLMEINEFTPQNELFDNLKLLNDLITDFILSACEKTTFESEFQYLLPPNIDFQSKRSIVLCFILFAACCLKVSVLSPVKVKETESKESAEPVQSEAPKPQESDETYQSPNFRNITSLRPQHEKQPSSHTLPSELQENRADVIMQHSSISNSTFKTRECTVIENNQLSIKRTRSDFRKSSVDESSVYETVSEQAKVKIMTNLQRLFQYYCKLKVGGISGHLSRVQSESNAEYMDLREYMYFCQDFGVQIDVSKPKNLDGLKVLYRLMTTISGLNFNKFVKIIKYVSNVLYLQQNPPSQQQVNMFAESVPSYHKDTSLANHREEQVQVVDPLTVSDFDNGKSEAIFFYYCRQLGLEDRKRCDDTRRKNFAKEDTKPRNHLTKIVIRKIDPSQDSLIKLYLPKKNSLSKDQKRSGEPVFEKLYKNALYDQKARQIIESARKQQEKSPAKRPPTCKQKPRPESRIKGLSVKKQAEFLQNMNAEVISKANYAELAQQLKPAPPTLPKPVEERQSYRNGTAPNPTLQDPSKSRLSVQNQMSLQRVLACINYGKC